MDTVEDYISQFSEEVKEILNQFRSIFLVAAPNAVEEIAYKMPAYKTDGKPLIYFAAYKNHNGVYATPSGHAEFAEDFSKYKQGKGSLQFPLKKEITFELFKKMVVFKAKENSSAS